MPRFAHSKARSMPFRLPVRRYLQSTEKTQAPTNRIGQVQWVLSRPLYRFHVIDLTSVPARNRPQALKLELTQWTPFNNSEFYIGWAGHKALVWAWDADKIGPAMAAHNLKRDRVQVVPESLLHSALHGGLALTRCLDGFEGQLWRQGQLAHSRWWPLAPASDEWLMFQRDAAIAPADQQGQAPAPRGLPLADRAWLDAAGSADDKAVQTERVAYAAIALALMVPTLWFGISILKQQTEIDALTEQKNQLQTQATPIAQARSQALDAQTRVNALRALAPQPEPLWLMAKVSQVLPQDKSYVKEWDQQGNQLKVTVTSAADISATNLIDLLQKAGPFRDVKALPGRDTKTVTFQMEVANQ